jgi:Dolichyl-phosphate-mannose-protein mannosyltransferase
MSVVIMPTVTPPVRLPVLFALAAILILAAVLRLWDIGTLGLTVDELGSLETAAGRGQLHLRLPREVWLDPPPVVTGFEGAAPIWQIAPMMDSDVHPPLYFILLRIWEDLFGDSDVAIRVMSVVAGVVGVGLIFDVGRLLGTPAAGLWAALLMAVAQAQIVCSQDARPYALAISLILAAADAVVRMDRFGPTPRPRIALAITLTCACLTHYFVLPAVAALTLYALWRSHRKDRRMMAFLAAAVGLFVFALWGKGMWEQRKNFTDPWMYWFVDNAPDHVLATFRRFAGLPIQFLSIVRDRWTMWSGLLFVLPCLLIRRRPYFFLLALWLLGCCGLVAVLDLLRGTDQLDSIKYTVFGAPAAYLLFPLLVADARPLLRNALPAVALLAAVLAIPASYNHADSAWQDLAKKLDQLRQPGNPVVFAGSTWGHWYTGALYMEMERYARPIDGPVALLDEPASPQFASSLPGQRAWLVMSWTNQSPNVLLPGIRVRLVRGFPFVGALFELNKSSEIDSTTRP